MKYCQGGASISSVNEHVSSQFHKCFCILQRQQEGERERGREKQGRRKPDIKERRNQTPFWKPSLTASAFFLKSRNLLILNREILESSVLNDSRTFWTRTSSTESKMVVIWQRETLHLHSISISRRRVPELSSSLFLMLETMLTHLYCK